MKPWELEQIDLYTLNTMIGAFARAEAESFDTEMQRTAWAVALIMNSSGNYKKAIKPTQLYTPMEEELNKRKDTKENNKSREELQNELLQAFNL